MRRIVKSVVLAMGIVAAGCHTCDVCDDCGDSVAPPELHKKGCATCGAAVVQPSAPVVVATPAPTTAPVQLQEVKATK